MLTWLSWIIISGCVLYFAIYCFHIYNLSKKNAILMEMVIETKIRYADRNESDIQQIDILVEKLQDAGIKAKKKKFRQTELMDSTGSGDKVIRVYVLHSQINDANRIYTEVFEEDTY